MAEPRGGRGAPTKKEAALVTDLASQASQYTESLREGNKLLNALFATEDRLLTITEAILNKSGKKLQVEEDTAEAALRALKAQDSINDSLKEQFGGAVNLAEKFQDVADIVKLAAVNPFTAVLSLITLAVVSAIKFQKVIADTRKDLGVSAGEAIKLNTAFKGLEVAGKAFGLEAEDFKASFQAAREDLGASTDEALSLSLNLAKTAMESGTTAKELTTVLSVLESISSASRDTLLNQLEQNRALIEQAGLAPGDIFSDIAQNAKLFAEFARDGADELVRAAIEAKKLGLNLGAVETISESLLNFETSISDQLNASLLLGRQINLDRARQLALAGDQEGVLQEIVRQVGSEAEFNRLNVIQRRALARSVGVNVEQLSRLVRNNTAGGAAAAAAGGSNVFSDPESHRLLGAINRKLA